MPARKAFSEKVPPEIEFAPLHNGRFPLTLSKNKWAFLPQIFKLMFIGFCHLHKEIVEKRHGEPIKFLFLPKMGLFGSHARAVLEKKLVMNYELLLRTVFLSFHGQNLFFIFFLHSL